MLDELRFEGVPRFRRGIGTAVRRGWARWMSSEAPG